MTKVPLVILAFTLILTAAALTRLGSVVSSIRPTVQI